jgi:hypothetical protein
MVNAKTIPEVKMVRQTHRVLLFLLCMAAFCGSCGSLLAQTQKTITLRMMDGKTGKLIATTDFLVRIDHQQTVHADWVTMNEDGTGKLTLPGDASLLSIHASYDSSTSLFINCDANKDYKASNTGPILDRWYSVSDILTKGIVAPNDCIGTKVPDKLQVFAKPGEFIFFVRRLTAREQFHE